jgi:hypothetical protein
VFRNRFQRIRRRTDQLPFQTRGRVLKLDLSIESSLHYRVDDRVAKTAALWRSHGRSVALRSTHREDITFKLPIHVNAAGICREYAVFSGIGPAAGSNGCRYDMGCREAQEDARQIKRHCKPYDVTCRTRPTEGPTALGLQ